MQQYFVGREPHLPHSVLLSDGELCFERWLRVLPNQRYVGIAQWNGEQVLAKVFTGKKASRHYQRELLGIQALNSQSIPSVRLLFHQQLDKRLFIIVLQWINGKSLNQIWQEAEHKNGFSQQQTEILQQALELTASMHKKGLYQEDLHLDNFIQTTQGLKVIDAGGIRVQRLGHALTSQVSCRNVAVLFAQLSRKVDAFVKQVFLSFSSLFSFDINDLNKEVGKIRQWRAKDIWTKTERDCSLFIYEKTPHRRVSAARENYSLVVDIVANPDAFIERGHVYKTGGAATVARVEHQNQIFIIKRNNIKNFAHWLKRFWRKSRAWHSYQMAFLLAMLEIPTSMAFVVVERRLYFARREAWLITEYSGEQHLYSVFEPYIESGDVPKERLDSLKALLNSMIAAQLSHGDLKAYNIFWHNSRFELIDLDSAKWHRGKAGFAKAFRKDRQRLLRNWPKDSALYKKLDRELPKL